MTLLRHWCCKENHFCSMEERRTTADVFMGVSVQSWGSTVLHWCFSVTRHQRLHSLPVSSSSVSLPLPSLLFFSSFTHTLPHRGCLNRWKSRSEPSKSLIWFTANIDRCISTLLAVMLRISSEEMQPGFSSREFHIFHCGYLPAVVEGCSWRAMCWFIWGM